MTFYTELWCDAGGFDTAGCILVAGNIPAADDHDAARAAKRVREDAVAKGWHRSVNGRWTCPACARAGNILVRDPASLPHA